MNAIHAYWDSLGVAVGHDFSNEPFYDSIPDPFVRLKNEPINILDNPRSGHEGGGRQGVPPWISSISPETRIIFTLRHGQRTTISTFQSG